MKPRKLASYRAPHYPDRLTLAQSDLHKHQPRRWLQPAVAAAMAAALTAGLGGCASHERKPAEPKTGDSSGQVEPQSGDSGARLAGAPPMMHGNTEENLPAPGVTPGATAAPKSNP